eukprot:NODE_431_length_1015_cov_734.272257_g273_i0.p1 GENE.NODE_431_length_1015_cov_734.272257_g273_i0~~NODE_431_length_1015_cov_734.272257_g273_i0.p1  ORF type:complete len:230 (+),score=115.21 NODE_431_length_1015_cov_734.272257_g273_i0:35-691(+)
MGGVCAYQRLRHLVMDKWQVREKSGELDAATLQPVKGRKRGGGIKVGEMERDVLLAHGCTATCLDRLYSSGLTAIPFCDGCGAFLSLRWSRADAEEGKGEAWCVYCKRDDPVQHTRMVPFSFVYFATELLGMNIETFLGPEEEDYQTQSQRLRDLVNRRKEAVKLEQAMEQVKIKEEPKEDDDEAPRRKRKPERKEKKEKKEKTKEKKDKKEKEMKAP